MAKKYTQTAAAAFLSLAMLLSTSGNIYAIGGDIYITDNGDGTGNIEASTDFETSSSTQDTTSDNQSGMEESSNSSTGSINNSSSGPAWNSSQEQAHEYKQNIREIFKQLLNSISQNNIYGNGSYAGLFTMGEMSVPSDTLFQLYENISGFKSLLGEKGSSGNSINSQFNRQDSEVAESSVATADNLSELTAEQQEQIMEMIGQNEGIDMNLFADRELPFKLNSSDLIHSWANILVREDIIFGGMKDSINYTDRLACLEDYVSNSMEDYCVVTALTDYHISSVNTQYISYEDYEPDTEGEPTIRWELVNNATGQVVKSDTGNYTSMKYTNVPAGDYTLRTLQHKKATKSIRVYYDVRQYLIDKNSQTLLYFYNLSVSGADSRDSGKYVEIIRETSDEWVEQMSRQVHINSLGEVETETSGTERVQ